MGALILYICWVFSLAAATLRWPAVAIGGVLCANGLFQWAQSSIPLFAAHPLVSNYLVGSTLILALLVTVLQQKPLLKSYPAAGWLSLGLLVYALISVLWSVNPEATWGELRGRAPYLMVTVILCPMLITDTDDAKAAMNTLVLFGTVLVAALLLTSDFSRRGVESIEGYGASLNPLGLASMGIYVAIAATLLNFRGVGRLLQFLRWGMVGLAMMLVVFTQSRGQFLAGFLVLMAFLPISRQIRNKWGFIGSALGLTILAGLSFWLVSSFGSEHRWQFDTMTSNFYETRLEMAHNVLSYWINSNPLYWLLGLGSSASFDTRVNGAYPHIVVAEVLAELGFIGFTMFMALIFVTARSTLRLSKMVRHDPVQRGVLAAVSALFWLNFILSFKQGSLLQSLDMLLFAIVLGRFELAVRDEQASMPLHEADLHPPTRIIEIQPVR